MPAPFFVVHSSRFIVYSLIAPKRGTSSNSSMNPAERKSKAPPVGGAFDLTASGWKTTMDHSIGGQAHPYIGS